MKLTDYLRHVGRPAGQDVVQIDLGAGRRKLDKVSVVNTRCLHELAGRLQQDGNWELLGILAECLDPEPPTPI